MTNLDLAVGPQDTKKPWRSKTFVLNVVLGALGVLHYAFPEVLGLTHWLELNSGLVAMIWGGMNAALRCLTKDKISLTD